MPIYMHGDGVAFSGVSKAWYNGVGARRGRSILGVGTTCGATVFSSGMMPDVCATAEAKAQLWSLMVWSAKW